jgi:hypothetical protein
MTQAVVLNPTSLAEEWLAVHGIVVLRDLVYGFRSASLMTPFPGVTDSIDLAELTFLKDIISEYTGDENDKDDAIQITNVKLNVAQFDTSMKFELNDKKMRAFNKYLKGMQDKGLETDDEHVISWLMNPIQEKRLMEMEDGVWQAELVVPVAGVVRSFKQRFNGLVKIAKLAVAASKGTMVATGAINNTNANDKVNLVFKAANKVMRENGFAIFCNHNLFDNYCDNRWNVANVSDKMIPYKDTGYMGVPLTLGGQKTFLIPIAGFPDGDGLLACDPATLAYGFEYESRISNWRVEPRGWKTWIGNAFDFGVQILVQKTGRLLTNDRL